jgi:hypothetical protein
MGPGSVYVSPGSTVKAEQHVVNIITATAAEHLSASSTAHLKPLGNTAIGALYGMGAQLLRGTAGPGFNLEAAVADAPPAAGSSRKKHDTSGLKMTGARPAVSSSSEHSKTSPGNLYALGSTMPGELQTHFVRGPVLGEHGTDAPSPSTRSTEAQQHPPHPVYRFSHTETRWLRPQSQGTESKDSAQLSVSTWNAGPFRGRDPSAMELFRTGSFHFLIGQEVGFQPAADSSCALPLGSSEATESQVLASTSEEQQFAAIKEAGFDICANNYCMIAARTSSCQDLKKLCTFNGEDCFAAIIVKVVLKHMHAGLSECLTLASFHLHNTKAKKPVVAQGACTRFLTACKTHGVDIIGYDLNQGVGHFEQVLKGQGGGSMIKPPSDDCVGFAIPSYSKLIDHSVRSKYYNLVPGDLTWGPNDAASHWMVTMHCRLVQQTGKRIRSAGSGHNARRDEARHGRRAAKRLFNQTDTGRGTGQIDA